MCKKFVYGVAVSDYNFIGREVETKRLMNNFRGGINTILMSPRRLGKTSLVMRVCEKLKSEDIKNVELITSPGARYDASVKAVIRKIGLSLLPIH